MMIVLGAASQPVKKTRMITKETSLKMVEAIVLLKILPV
jgi:hypothetical protein